MLAVVVLAVAGQHSLHDPANRIVLHLNQETNVVGHQTVGIEIERAASISAVEECR